MFLRHSPLPPLAALMVLAAGCCCPHRTETATDLQMGRIEQMREDANAHFAHMADNAILHDMSVADFHFVPHTAELSGTGVARLDRMAPLLNAYGGKVRYDTALFEEGLIQKRIDHVREYLALTGCDMSRVEVKAEISGGRGERAKKLIAVEEKDTAPASSATAAGAPALVPPTGGVP